MMQSVWITIPGRPLSKDNEKITNRLGKPFLSKKFKDYAAFIKREAERQMKEHGWTPFNIPVFVKMEFFFKNDVRLDLFNAPKSVCDALNGIVWEDDHLIHQGQLCIKFDDNERVDLKVIPAYLSSKGFNLPGNMPNSIVKSIREYSDRQMQ